MVARSAPSEKDKKRFQQAMQLHQQGQSREAIRLFDQVRKSWGDDADIWYLIALAHGQLGEINEVARASEKALKLNGIHFGALCTLANAQVMQGNAEEALENYRKSLAIKPDDPNVLDNYGRALSLLGRRDEAIERFNKILQGNQNYAPAHAGLAKAQIAGGYPEKGFEGYKNALRIDPHLVEAHLGLGHLYTGLGNHAAAEIHYQEALKFKPGMMHAHIGLAHIYRHRGDFDKALKSFEMAETIAPQDPYLVAARADTLQRMGDDEAAYELLSVLKERKQMPALGAEAYSRVCRKFGVCDDALELIEVLVESPATDTMEKQMLCYAAGNLLDKQERYTEAFERFEIANGMVKVTYVAADQEKVSEQIINCFSQDAMRTIKRATTGSQRPIFILGMPRSGTTLVEQILSSHSDVFGAGELLHMQERMNEIRALKAGGEDFDLEQMLQLRETELTGFANRYLEDITRLNSDARFVVDKLPHNFMMIGLINLLFPDAHIIHCRRSPLDNGLSIYFQSFLWAHNYATELKNIGHFYNQYRRLMKHWEQVIDIPILHVDYEDVVDDSEAMSRKILDFCGLEWQDSVLEFHKTGRAVATLSFDQVRQPIYKTSKQRWKNYQEHIELLRSAISAEYLA